MPIRAVLTTLAILATLLTAPTPAAAANPQRVTDRRPAPEMVAPWAARHKHLPYPHRRR